MLTVENISKSFGDVAAISGVSLSIADSEIIGLTGPSGSGKSVLLKLLGGIMPPDSGTVDFTGDLEFTSSRVGFSFQEGALFDSLSVLENVAFPMTVNRRNSVVDMDEAIEKANSILRSVGLIKHANKLPGQISGGMRRRVGIARALVRRPELVLLDDPTGGLDPVAASVIMSLVRELHREYQPIVILVSHDLRRLIPSVERILTLFEGKLVCDTSVDKLETEAPQEVLAFLSTRYDFSKKNSPDANV